VAAAHPGPRLSAPRALLALLALLAAVWLLTPTASAQGERLRVSSSGNTDPVFNGEYVWLEAFMARARAAGFQILFHPGSSLGKEEERTELVNLGLVQINMAGLSEIQIYSRTARALSIPFIMDDYGQFDQLLRDTDFLETVNAELIRTNLQVIDAALLGGMSGLFNTRSQVIRPEDLAEIRIRAMSRSDMALIASWDARSVQVAWEEVAQALETGIAHGYLNPPLVPLMFGHTGQIRHFTDLRLYPATRWVVVSRSWYQGLEPQARATIDAALADGHAANRAWARKILNREREALESAGIVFRTLSAEERQAFAAPVHSRYRDSLMPQEYARLRAWLESLPAGPQ